MAPDRWQSQVCFSLQSQGSAVPGGDKYNDGEDEDAENDGGNDDVNSDDGVN